MYVLHGLKYKNTILVMTLSGGFPLIAAHHLVI